MLSHPPSVSGSFGDKPTLTFPTGPAPAVAAGDTIVVDYLGQPNSISRINDLADVRHAKIRVAAQELQAPAGK